MPVQPAPRRSGPWASVGRTAGAKMVVMVVAGVFGLINTRLILSHFGPDAYAQYGLLATFPTLMPFTDLGIGAVILNVVAGSTDPAHDSTLRRTLTTANLPILNKIINIHKDSIMRPEIIIVLKDND